MDDSRWTQCTPSEHAWERAALTYLKTLLPNVAPYRAWANAEFQGSDKSLNEVDLLVVTPRQVVVLEVKSWSGTLVGDAGTWQQTHRQPVDNPLIAANKKARKLKTLLASQPALRSGRPPWVEAAVFLSDSSAGRSPGSSSPDSYCQWCGWSAWLPTLPSELIVVAHQRARRRAKIRGPITLDDHDPARS